MRFRRWWYVIPLAVLGGIVGWYLISPLFVTRSVSEAFPTAEMPMASPTEAMEIAMAEAPKVMDEPMPEAQGQISLLASGAFYPIAHEGRGSAGIYRLADGRLLLRFEAFEVLNGPDLHVWLVPVDPVPNTVGVEIEGYLDLGELKGNVGDQNYDLPEGFDLGRFRSVVIWCQPFRVPFAAAPLELTG